MVGNITHQKNHHLINSLFVLFYQCLPAFVQSQGSPRSPTMRHTSPKITTADPTLYRDRLYPSHQMPGIWCAL
jgi:hypothetical protein